VDAASASGGLLSTVFRPADGPVANVWGKAFESVTQELIDASPWRPPEPYRELIGRKIKDGPNAITDIDAVALNGSTLLLIDCKSFRASGNFWRGEYGAVLSMRRTVEDANKTWESRLAAIKARPEMLQIPNPHDTEIDGFVVMPFVPFVLPGPATSLVSGLFRVSTITELLLRAAFGVEQRGIEEL
jgi:hypothetical protein